MSVATRACALVGAPFRLHGRDPVHGLDCVGVVALATGRVVPTGYSLRGGDADAIVAAIDAILPRSVDPASGDVLLMATGPGQLHLAIRVEGGIVHADAGLRRVVRRPGEPPWPPIAMWRAEGRA